MSHRHCEDNMLILLIDFIRSAQAVRLPGLFPP